MICQFQVSFFTKSDNHQFAVPKRRRPQVSRTTDRFFNDRSFVVFGVEVENLFPFHHQHAADIVETGL